MKPTPSTFRAAALAAVSLLVILVSGCGKDAPQSATEYVAPPQGATPVVSSIDPPFALAGVTVITITGQNFSPVAANNLVYFSGTPGTVMEASATQLKLKAPNVVGDTVYVEVQVAGALALSPRFVFKTDAAVAEVGRGTEEEESWAVATDAEGNAYVSLTKTADSSPIGVRKITADGTKINYASPVAGATKFQGMRMGRAGVLFAAASTQALYQIPANPGGTPVTPSAWLAAARGTVFYDVEFDPAGNLWAVGNIASIYRIRADKSTKTFPFRANLRTVRFYSGALYAGGQQVGTAGDTTEGVWKFPVLAGDSLGTPELYYDFKSFAPGRKVNAITFAASGDMYVGTDAPEGIVIVHPGKTAEGLHPGVMQGPVVSLAWGTGTTLYASRASSGTTIKSRTFRINTLVQGAPYYSR